jgi:hypothetical protein
MCHASFGRHYDHANYYHILFKQLLNTCKPYSVCRTNTCKILEKYLSDNTNSMSLCKRLRSTYRQSNLLMIIVHNIYWLNAIRGASIRFTDIIALVRQKRGVCSLPSTLLDPQVTHFSPGEAQMISLFLLLHGTFPSCCFALFSRPQ